MPGTFFAHALKEYDYAIRRFQIIQEEPRAIRFLIVKGARYSDDKLDEVKALIREQAEAAGEDPDQVIEDLWQHGRQEDLREDLRLRAALDRVAAEVKPIPLEQAQARDAIWTPDKESPEQETKLWTPGN